MLPIKTIKGFAPICFIPGGLLLSKNYCLYTACHDIKDPKPLACLPHDRTHAFMSKLRLTARLFRTGVAYGCTISNTQVLLSADKSIFLLDLPTGEITRELTVAHRPLTMTHVEGIPNIEDGVYFGDYGSNPELREMSIHHRSRSGKWRVIYTFPAGQIDHIHAIVPDSLRGLLWLLTGDLGPGTGIWSAKKNFKDIEPFTIGDQAFRSTWVYPKADRLVYGTDTPIEANAIYSIPIESRQPRKVASIVGSCIYSCEVEKGIAFATTVEPDFRQKSRLAALLDRKPGPGILGNEATLMFGDEEVGFSKLGTWAKDWLPMGLFQFGSIRFPTGQNPTGRIYAYGTALQGFDDKIIVFSNKMDSR